MAQHRFAEALDVGRELLALDSTSVAAAAWWPRPSWSSAAMTRPAGCSASSPPTRATSGVAPSWPAGTSCTAVRGSAPPAPPRPRRSRPRHAMPKEQIAWFHLRLGDLALRTGHWMRPSASSTPGSGSRPTTIGCWGRSLGSTRCGTTGRQRGGGWRAVRGTGARPRDARLLHDTYVRPRRQRHRRGVLPRDGAGGAPPARPLSPGLEPVSARSRSRGPARPGQVEEELATGGTSTATTCSPGRCTRRDATPRHEPPCSGRSRSARATRCCTTTRG